MNNDRFPKSSNLSNHKPLFRSVVLGALTLLMSFTSNAFGQTQNNAELNNKLQQALISAQQQVGWLEQEAARTRAIALQASQESASLKKDLEEISKGTEALQTAETKATQSLTELETRLKEEQEALKKLEEELAPAAEAEKEKRTKLEGLQKRATETKQASEKSAGGIKAFEEAIQYNQQRRTAWVEYIARLESEFRTKQENELQISNQLESLTGEEPKLQKNLDRLKQQISEQQEALKNALAETQKLSSSARDQAVLVRDGVSGSTKPADSTTATSATGTKSSEDAKPSDKQDGVTDETQSVTEAKAKTDQQTATANQTEDSKAASSLTSTLESCQSELSKLQEAFAKVGAQTQSLQASLQEYQASQLKMFEHQHRIRETKISQKLAAEASTATKDAVAAAEKELEAIKKSTTDLKEKLAALEKEFEKQIEDADKSAKELADFVKVGVAKETASSRSSKIGKARAAKQQSMATEAEFANTKSRIEQVKTAIAHNTQHHSQRRWFATVADDLVQLRKLEEEAAKTNLASAKQTVDALTATIQKLSQKK